MHRDVAHSLEKQPENRTEAGRAGGGGETLPGECVARRLNRSFGSPIPNEHERVSDSTHQRVMLGTDACSSKVRVCVAKSPSKRSFLRGCGVFGREREESIRIQTQRGGIELLASIPPRQEDSGPIPLSGRDCGQAVRQCHSHEPHRIEDAGLNGDLKAGSCVRRPREGHSQGSAAVGHVGNQNDRGIRV